jgi:type VI secretion system protein ImpI
MVDRFDPKALEAELAAVGALEKLLAGGRRAKLWELYEKRYREIARSAETRFMGEVGADFRDAYETGEK